MARIRTIKPEFWTSEQVMECSTTARLLFIGLWNFCDDAGRHPFSAKTLKAEVFPGDDISSDDVLSLLEELESNGLIERYEAAGRQYLQVTGWRHQKIEKPNFKHPEPEIRQQVGDKSSNESQSSRRSVVERSTPEGKGMEGNGYGVNLSLPPSGSKPKRSTRLNPDWTLPDDWRRWTIDNIDGSTASQIDEQEAQFRDYWLAKSGQSATKADWQATWRTWCRNAVGYGKLGGAPPAASKPTVVWWATDQSIEAKGRELGMTPRPGESWQQFKGRIESEIQRRAA